MLDIKTIRDNLDLAKETATFKKCDVDFTALLEQDEKRRSLLQEVEEKKARRNSANETIAKLKKEKKDATETLAEMKALSGEIKALDKDLQEIEEGLEEELLKVPNLANEAVPKGADEKANEVLREWGEKPNFSFDAKDHVELAEQNDLLDLQAAGKISGTGFGLYVGEGAKLERALINFMLEFHIEKHGYTEVLPPYLVTRETMTGTGQLPKMEEDMYRTSEDDLFLIPTAEVPVTNIHRNDILNEKDLPIKYVSFTPCFRREAGSYGKETRGLGRVHQFNKVELVKFVKPEESYQEHDLLLQDAEDILQALGLPYRVVLLSCGDTSFAASKCYDLEVWAPGAKQWYEVSSCSNFEDFQARRTSIRYRPKEGKKVELVHTLNASGLALPRIFIAILENYQKEDGSIEWPDVLKPYLESRL